MKNLEKLKVPPEKLRFYPEIPNFEGKTSEDITPGEYSFFQKRGFEAFDFGISIQKKGFNIYAAGQYGTGKTSSIRKYLEKHSKNEKKPDDVCYVHNFKDKDKPHILTMTAGEGEHLVKDMEDLLDYLQYQIPRQMESESFEIKKGEIARWYQENSQENYQQIEEKAEEIGFKLKTAQGGLVINPIVDGESIGKEEFDKLPEEKKVKIKENEEKVQEELIAFFHRDRVLEKEYKEKLADLKKNMVRLIMKEPINNLKKAYKSNERIKEYLRQLENHTVENYENFFIYRDIKEGKSDSEKYRKPAFSEYKVNLLINNKDTEGAPVVYETNPTFQNIMGYFEYEEKRNSLFTDFTKMKPGALHKANGGYLIIQANDILKNYFAWTALKRSLRNRNIEMDEMDVNYRYRANIFPKPEPMPLNVKIIIIGDEFVYHLLYNFDDDFKRLFRVKAVFESRTNVTAKNTEKLVEFISRVVQEDCELPFDISAIRRILFYSSRNADDQKRFHICASTIVNVIVESDYWARKSRKKKVTEKEVIKAIDQKNKRHDKLREKYYSSIRRGLILIDVKGEETGQINGLSVYSLGDYSFGIPSRITARAWAGKRGIINIDREVSLSGSIHDKGAMILAGYIGGLFGRNKSLSLSASIAFEQSYGNIDGDSASSTELYALLSAISGLSIKQGIAVTGSINQKGEIQPVGGINEKIEGFFNICKIKRLDGTQGVIIPKQNEENLNLNDDVVKAVLENKFHIWAITNVKRGIEILTGR
ncbi:MAG: ATP-binding protein, partial [bacterium]